VRKILSISSFVVFIIGLLFFLKPNFFTSSDNHTNFLLICIIVSFVLALLNIKNIWSMITIFLLVISVGLFVIFTIGMTAY